MRQGARTSAWLAAVGCSFVLAASSCSLDAPSVMVAGGLFSPRLSGDVSLEDSVATDLGDVDLDSDLALDERQNVPYVMAGVSAGNFHLGTNAFRTEQSSRGTLTAGFGDITVGSDVKSDLELTLAQLSLTYDVVDLAGFRLAPGLAADFIDLHLEVVEDLSHLTEEIDATAPVPLLFLQAEYTLPVLPLSFLAEVGGMQATQGDFDGTLIDAQVLGRYRVSGPLELFGGYRYLRATLDGKTDDRNFDSSLVLQGLVVGGSLRF